MHVLVLDSHFQPLDIVHFHKAFTLMFNGKAEPIEFMEMCVRSATQEHKVPAVIKKTTSRSKLKKSIPFTRRNVFIRDGFQCQYCGVTTSNLTFDHVVPLIQGGTTDWYNILTACQPCNYKKAGRTPKQAEMVPISTPQEPKYTPFFYLKAKLRAAKVHSSWSNYLYE